MEINEREAIWWLSRTPGWGAVKLAQLSALVEGPLSILHFVQEAGENAQTALLFLKGRLQERWGKLSGEKPRITPGDLTRLWEHRKEIARCREDYWYWSERGVRFVTLWDEEYPKRLLPLYGKPFALYVRGSLPSDMRPAAAVIGARACSGYGAKQSRRFAGELAASGVQIISGLAYGVDSEGHWGALKTGVREATWAVLGCGVEQCYPREHEKLAVQILENGGGLLSEFPPGTKPAARNFPIRNRVISGLSDCILVMEARKRSGSLITVDQALEQGKEVFALPGRVGDALSEGCHQLIQNGAALLTDSSQVLEFLAAAGRAGEETEKKRGKRTDGWEDKRRTVEEKHCGESPAGQAMGAGITNPKKVYDCLGSENRSVDDIMTQTGLSLVQVRAALLDLLLSGQILEKGKGYYSRADF